MLQINVSQQVKAPIGWTRNYAVNDRLDIAGYNSRVQGNVTLMRTNRSILAKGTLYTEIELTCGRCLSPFTCPLTIHIEDEYFPTKDLVTGSSIPLPDDPDCFTIDERNTLDLTEAVRQYALLAIPMKPLCHEGCAGICPECGGNLNQALCNCTPKPAGPRWSKLSKLVSASNAASVNEQKGI